MQSIHDLLLQSRYLPRALIEIIFLDRRGRIDFLIRALTESIRVEPHLSDVIKSVIPYLISEKEARYSDDQVP